MSLTDKYRPRTLADVVGQPWAVHQLQEFVANPVPCAFLFEGETGTGKTSAALALAHDLGVDVDGGPFGGFHVIASGEQTGESVRRVMDGLRLHTLSGSGWKVLVVNEADCMTPNAAYIWLDVLERLPARTVVVFTTNHADKIPARLRDRCERFRFESGYLALAPYLPELVARVWKGETGRADPPELDALGPLQDEQGNISVRRVIQALVPWIRNGIKPEAKSMPVVTPATMASDRPDWPTLGRRRLAGESTTRLAKEIGLPETTVRGRLNRMGFRPTNVGAA
jgi:ATPase family associated with various cellular activities (AAA)